MKADNFGSAMTQDGICYQAVEIVFHTPGEHTLNGERFDMEMQVIHKATSDGHIGKKLVIAHLFKFDPD